MRALFIATASALFFAYVITELTTRLWPGDYLKLLMLAFVALLLSGLLNLRLAGWLAAGRQADKPDNEKRSHNERQSRASAPPPRPGPARSEQPRRAAQREAEASGPRETGTVKWFNRTKGFGFVIRESGEEIFVHQRSIRAIGEGDDRRRPSLKDGQTVHFVVAQREKGLQAEDVVPEE